ncbi:hypothetical protein BJY00DRAFT_315965 [Aspergillus carlsbadensis]|nr:hypothetical protein BJY00DRAFT_315965 [Aspergillus carlsbadensis]
MTSSLAPSPTSWTDLGCYFDDPADPPLLETRVRSNDDALMIGGCQDACYRAGYEFAGVKGGNECWCSPFVGGEWAVDQGDCNLSCTGDRGEVCGGVDVVSVFGAVEKEEEEGEEEEGQDEEEEEGQDEDEDEEVGGETTSSGTASASAPTSGTEGEDENAVDDSPAESKASRTRVLVPWRYFTF